MPEHARQIVCSLAYLLLARALSLAAMTLQIQSPDTIVIRDTANVTAACQLTGSDAISFNVTWNLAGLSSDKVQIENFQLGASTLVSQLTLDNVTARELYGQTLLCDATHPLQNAPLSAVWEPTVAIVVPPPPPHVTGPLVLMDGMQVFATCTSFGAVGPQPRIRWRNSTGNDVTASVASSQVPIGQVPHWNVTANLNTFFRTAGDVMRFTCAVTWSRQQEPIVVTYMISAPGLELHEADGPILAGSDVTVTCRLRLVPSLKEQQEVNWDTSLLPAGLVKVVRSEGRYWEDAVLTVRNVSVPDLYGKTVYCSSCQDSHTQHITAWEPTGKLIAPPPSPIVKGPRTITAFRTLEASCTSVGALGPPPRAFWLDSDGYDVTSVSTAVTTNGSAPSAAAVGVDDDALPAANVITAGDACATNVTSRDAARRRKAAAVRDVPYWNVTAVLRVKVSGLRDIMAFSCVVRQKESATSISVPYTVLLVGRTQQTPGDLELRDRLLEVGELALDYRLPDLDTKYISARYNNKTEQWAEQVGRVVLFDPSYYSTFRVFALVVGVVLLLVMLGFCFFTYLRRVNESCYCC